MHARNICRVSHECVQSDTPASQILSAIPHQEVELENPNKFSWKKKFLTQTIRIKTVKLFDSFLSITAQQKVLSKCKSEEVEIILDELDNTDDYSFFKMQIMGKESTQSYCNI